MVMALDRKSGKVLWEQVATTATPGEGYHQRYGSFASNSPVTDGKNLWASFGSRGVYCYDLNGKLIWKKNDFKEAKMRLQFGEGTATVISGNTLLLNFDQEGGSFLLALDKLTGKELWKVDRDEQSSWAAPLVVEHEGQKQVIVSATKKVRAYDLKDGKLIWEFGGMSSIVIPTPFSRDGLLYLTSGYVGDQNRPVYVIKPGAKGDITLAKGAASSEFVLWYLPQAGPYNPSPLLYGDIYYTLLDRGFLTAHDAKTGKEIFGKQRIDEAAGAFTASPWASKGKIYSLSEDGDTFVFQAGREYKLLGKNSLDEMCMTTPAIASGSLIIRTASKLYRIAN